MSRMSQLHAELTEQAYDLGFESIEEAEANGYHVAYVGNRVKLAFDASKAQEEAHEAWLKEKDMVLGDLMNLLTAQAFNHDIIERAYLFIKEQCHD